MASFSIVIVAKDASAKIGRLMDSIQGLTDDVIVCDTGSTDDTVRIVERYPARVYHMTWKGYGVSKNEAIGFAKYDWILSLDSDEKIDGLLYQELKAWAPPAAGNVVYTMRWKNFFGTQWIKHSHWGANWKNRLFNRHIVQWDDAIAHEDICAADRLAFVRFNGYLEHYSFSDRREYASKMVHSAMITALKYHKQGKPTSYFKLMCSPVFTYVKVLLFNVAFLDGRLGWLIAKTSAYYTYIKYARLKELNEQAQYKPAVRRAVFRVEQG